MVNLRPLLLYGMYNIINILADEPVGTVTNYVMYLLICRFAITRNFNTVHPQIMGLTLVSICTDRHATIKVVEIKEKSTDELEPVYCPVANSSLF